MRLRLCLLVLVWKSPEPAEALALASCLASCRSFSLTAKPQDSSDRTNSRSRLKQTNKLKGKLRDKPTLQRFQIS